MDDSKAETNADAIVRLSFESFPLPSTSFILPTDFVEGYYDPLHVLRLGVRPYDPSHVMRLCAHTAPHDPTHAMRLGARSHDPAHTLRLYARFDPAHVLWLCVRYDPVHVMRLRVRADTPIQKLSLL